MQRYKFVCGAVEERYTVHFTPGSADAADVPVALSYTAMIEIRDNLWVVDSHWSSDRVDASLLEEIISCETSDDLP